MQNRKETAYGCIDCGEIIQTIGTAYCSCKTYNNHDCIEGGPECVEGKEFKCPIKRALKISTKNKEYFFEIPDDWGDEITLVKKERTK